MSLTSPKIANQIKKREHITYDKSWMLRLSHLMGMYSTYFDSTQHFKAFTMLNAAINFIQNDKQNRLHISPKNEIDYNTMLAFDELADDFKRLLGTKKVGHEANERDYQQISQRLEYLKRSEEDWTESTFAEYQELIKRLEQIEEVEKFTYIDLRAGGNLPDPKEDKVYIGRRVPIIYTWEAYPAPYVAFRINFVYTVMAVPPGGMFAVPTQIPMLDWSDPAVLNYRSNCVPYEYWVKQRTLLLNELMPVVFKLESLIAQFLHDEGYDEFSAKERNPANTDEQFLTQKPVDESDGVNKA